MTNLTCMKEGLHSSIKVWKRDFAHPFFPRLTLEKHGPGCFCSFFSKNVLSFQMVELGQGHQELILLTPLRVAGWVSSGMGQRASLSAPSPTFLTRIPLLHSVQNVKLGQVEATPWDWPLTDYICLDLIFGQHGDTGPHIFPLVISLTCPVFEKIP